MAITSKTQLQTDITASTFTAPQKTILGNIVDSYENVFPQLTTVQRDALTPTNGLVVYNTDTDTYQYWNGVAWFGIGQDLSTPLVVKVDLSSAEILALDATAKIVAVAAGAGTAWRWSSVRSVARAPAAVRGCDPQRPAATNAAPGAMAPGRCGARDGNRTRTPCGCGF